MWFLTVSVLRWSSAAICFVEHPEDEARRGGRALSAAFSGPSLTLGAGPGLLTPRVARQQTPGRWVFGRPQRGRWRSSDERVARSRLDRPMFALVEQRGAESFEP